MLLIEEDLIKQRKLTNTVIDTQRDTLFVFDPEEGKAILWNESFNLVSGYSNEEIKKLKAPESYYSPADLKKASESTSLVVLIRWDCNDRASHEIFQIFAKKNRFFLLSFLLLGFDPITFHCS